MTDYALSHEAEEEMHGIYLYTIMYYGQDQAETYSSILYSSFDFIAKNPNIGRDCSHIRKGYRRFEVEKHSVFYKKEGNRVLIIRVLHQKMDVLEILN